MNPDFKHLYEKHSKQFGYDSYREDMDWAFHEYFLLDEIHDILRTPREWQKCINGKKTSRVIAEGLLLRHILRLNTSRKNEWDNIFPFGDDLPNLKTLLQATSGAMVHIPMSHKKKPLLCRFYLLAGLPDTTKDHSSLLHGISKDKKVYIQFDDLEHHDFEGDSWQLGYKLMNEALKDDVCRIKRNLARNWIVTGEVRANKVTPVKIGNKFQTDPHKKYAWMLPAHFDEQKNQRMKNISIVKDLNGALRLIRGSGYESEQKQFPKQPEFLYIIPGESWGPIFLSVFALCPKKLRVFYTSKTKDLSEAISEFLIKHCNFTHRSIKLIDTSSNNLESIDSLFREQYGLDCSGNQKKDLIFNITGGNRLMALAAHMISTDYKIPMIYRNIDSMNEPNFDLITPIGENQYSHAVVSPPKHAMKKNFKKIPSFNVFSDHGKEKTCEQLEKRIFQS